ncbi:MAG: heavy metal-binding domain-containing protein [Salinarimonas sp.]
MLLSTTDNLEGFMITGYLGIVVGQAVIGEDMTKNFHTGIRNMSAGGRHDYAAELARARQQATGDLVETAGDLGADAVVGIAFDFETSGEASHHVILSIVGTAVTLRREAGLPG